MDRQKIWAPIPSDVHCFFGNCELIIALDNLHRIFFLSLQDLCKTFVNFFTVFLFRLEFPSFLQRFVQSFCELSKYLALVDLHQDFFLEKRFMQSFCEFYHGIFLLLIGTRVAFFSWRRDLCEVVCRVSCKRGEPAAHVLFHF